jgi:hypothetical protein
MRLWFNRNGTQGQHQEEWCGTYMYHGVSHFIHVFDHWFVILGFGAWGGDRVVHRGGDAFESQGSITYNEYAFWLPRPRWEPRGLTFVQHRANLLLSYSSDLHPKLIQRTNPPTQATVFATW